MATYKKLNRMSSIAAGLLSMLGSASAIHAAPVSEIVLSDERVTLVANHNHNGHVLPVIYYPSRVNCGFMGKGCGTYRPSR